jgi:voltage-gated potassium channel
LQSGPGAELPARGEPPRVGRWVVCGNSRFGRELSKDLRAEGLEVDVIKVRQAAGSSDGAESPDASDDAEPPVVLAEADLRNAVGFVAGTDNDTTNLSLVAMARRANPELFLAARQNRPSSGPLFAAMRLDALLVPTEMVAREVYAQLSTPLLQRFLRGVPGRSDEWAAGVVDRLTARCGRQLQTLWKVRLTPREAPALQSWLGSGGARLGDLLRDPVDRERQLLAVPLLVLRAEDATLAPGDEFVLATGDEILLAGRPAARRSLDTTLLLDAVGEYVVSGRHVPSSWIWRRLTRRPA